MSIEPNFYLAVESGWEANDLALRISEGHRETLELALDEAGIQHNLGAEFSNTTTEIVHAVITNEAFWPSLAAVIRMILRRHDGKRVKFRINGADVELDGYSADDATKLIEALMREGHAKRNANWARGKKLDKGDSKK
ncbi:hypothetical protein ACIA5G_07160 [Amycolatopsis sp. NPDC051758]|uniref:hypothetical protein n=1 Tax=Amycolatopsis sp. NPDC051758 TaxID=3363935 RepID=UPI00379004B6